MAWLWGYLWGIGTALAIVLVLLAALPRPAHSASFYPACLKPDGDWLHGVTRKECLSRDIKGRWYTPREIKKARRVM